MSILKAERSDVAELTLLVNTAYRGETSKKGWTTESHLIDGQRIDEQTMNSYFNNKSAFILKNMDATGKISGCVYLEKMGTAMYLGMLTVSPELQAKGIGRALLNEAETFAKTVACTMIRMTVITSRSELISYYERRGFYKTGQVFPFHHDEKFGIPKQHIELLVMEKKLDDSSLINQDNK